MTQSTNKVPLALAAQNLSQLMEAIDDGTLNETITRLFSSDRLAVADAVDRRIFCLRHFEDTIKNLKAIADEYRLKAKQLEHALETIKEKTVQIMEQVPDVPYVGELGRLRIQNNSQSALELKFELGKKSVSNILSESDIEKYQIPQELMETVTYTALKSDTVKKLVEAGEKLEWASVQRGRHLRYK